MLSLAPSLGSHWCDLVTKAVTLEVCSRPENSGFTEVDISIKWKFAQNLALNPLAATF